MFVVEHFGVGEPWTASRFELGYALGLVVGEGSFTRDRVNGCLSVKLHATDPQSRKREQLEEWAKKYGFRNRKKAVPADPELDYW